MNKIQVYVLLCFFVPTTLANCKVSGGGNGPTSCKASSTSQEDPGDPLYLTPLIKAGKTEEAQQAASVVDSSFHSVKSYSGFITVNEEFKSNIFFWYFPAKENDDSNKLKSNVPVILWNDGGPGISAFFSIFGQNGPFVGDSNGINFTANSYSWHQNYHMIYMDNPVEVGFSYTENEGGYITSGEDAAKDIYEFLVQFFTLFPNLKGNPFYNAGASFGATYAIQTAELIHQNNLKTGPSQSINLAGIIVDSPWIDPYTQSYYGDVLFNAGLINEQSRQDFESKENQIRDLLNEENYLEAFHVSIEITQMKSLNLTGYSALSSIYKDFPTFVNMTEFATLNSTRKDIHVGSLEFRFISLEQQSRMHPHFMRSSKSKLDLLLNAGYKFLLYVGNMDGQTGHLGLQKMFKSMSWAGANELVNGTKNIWNLNGRVAGYKTASSNAEFVLIRNAGHDCIGDQPAAVLNAVETFINRQ